MIGPALRLAALTVVLLGVFAGGLCLGAVYLPPADIPAILFAPNYVEDGPMLHDILWHLRMPRVVLAGIVGAGLAAAGAGYQGLFRNALAEPSVVSASSGAALGATVAIVGGWNVAVLGFGAVPLFALAGALLAVGTVYALASLGRGLPTLSLLLAGIAMSSFLAALVSLLMFLHEEQLAAIFSWLMGSLAGCDWFTVRVTGALVATSIVALWACSRSLDVLTFGEDAAATLGVNLARFRAVLVLAATLATAACVSASGIISFVGLIGPHTARLLVGPRHAVLFPASCLLGATLLIGADTAARTLLAPVEMPVGIVTSLLGGPFFLYLLIAWQREWNAEV